MPKRIKIRSKDRDDDELLKNFPDEVIRSFFSISRPTFSIADRPWDPPTDVYETKDNLVIKMEIAGVRQEDLDIILNDDTLIVRGRRDEEVTSEKENYHLMEIHYGRFERIFVLPNAIIPGKITASYEKGFLIISVPKRRVPPSVKINIE
ncbi:Hsp20/alpha crystallin family protein [Candidatus Sumerlaeota bacterium]|nr:Hsp20/alpha crystallin family protein [Candidatus Sumerlaeota bacterium]